VLSTGRLRVAGVTITLVRTCETVTFTLLVMLKLLGSVMVTWKVYIPVP
jgi:hypothetical protein